MKITIIAIVLTALGCEQSSPIADHEPTISSTQITLAASPPEASRPDLKRIEFGLKHDTEGFKATKWDESRARYIGEPCIDSWTIHGNSDKLTVAGTTRSTNTGGIVGDVSIYGGNLATSDKLTLLGKSDENGHFAINVALGSSGLAYDYLYTGGRSEPLVEYAIRVPPKLKLTQGASP